MVGARGLVGHMIEHGDDFADPDLDLGLLRLELPGQAGADIGVEPHRDLARQRRVRRAEVATWVVPLKPVARQNQS